MSGECICGITKDYRGMCAHCDTGTPQNRKGQHECHQPCARCDRRDAKCAVCGTSCATKAGAALCEKRCRDLETKTETKDAA
jgi:hypothetical protein